MMKQGLPRNYIRNTVLRLCNVRAKTPRSSYAKRALEKIITEHLAGSKKKQKKTTIEFYIEYDNCNNNNEYDKICVITNFMYSR